MSGAALVCSRCLLGSNTQKKKKKNEKKRKRRSFAHNLLDAPAPSRRASEWKETKELGGTKQSVTQHRLGPPIWPHQQTTTTTTRR